jgi:hypothetical protein
MPDYDVTGNIEWRAKCAILDVIANDLDIEGITTNVRKAGDTTTARADNSIAIDVLSLKGLFGCPEYQLKIDLEFETRASVDTTGERVDAMVGAVRDIFNGDDYKARFNDQQRGVHFHEIQETEVFSNDDKTTRRRIMSLDGQAYISE